MDDSENPLTARLRDFTERNPEAQIDSNEDGSFIKNPWGDESVQITLGGNSDDLIDDLNALRLPSRFSALWHKDSGDLEFIFAPVRPKDDLLGRSFKFGFKGSSHRCEFAECSDRLKRVASAARVLPPHGDTLHRNLQGIRGFLRYVEKNPEGAAAKNVLTSFWVRQLEIPEEEFVELARHLNFYMRYFDRESPVIVIHEESPQNPQSSQRVRYPTGTFPPEMLGRPLDPYLLGLWESAAMAYDTFRRFVYNYQILEYAAFYYLRDEVFNALRRILASPDLPSRLDEAAGQILDTLAEDRTSDDAKIVAVVQRAVDPEMLWREMQPDLDRFSQPTDFEGGYSVPALLKKGWAFEDFSSAWIPKLPDTLRKLRNALVHARETRQSWCIAPTRKNEVLLRPWSRLISATASQVIVYGEHRTAG